MMKKFIAIILSFVFLLLATSCSIGNKNSNEDQLIIIPDIYDVDENSAKNVLSTNGLIPRVKYEYNDDIEEGNVIKTEPEIGMSVAMNSKVTLYISKGPSYILSKRSTIEWYNISRGQDEWEFESPYIQEGTMYINCTVTFACDMEWQDDHNKGELFGNASINDTFDKTVPVSATYSKKEWNANETQNIVLEIPVSDLEITKPTNLYLELFHDDNEVVRLGFTMTW